MKIVGSDGRNLDAENLNEKQLEALSNEIRQRILKDAAEKPVYPSEIARRHGLSKQRAHYHFKKLQESGLIEQTGEEEKSGGKADLYRASADAYVFDTGAEGSDSYVSSIDEGVEEFLGPLLNEGEIEGKVVAGSADRHGPDQVRARDGHLAAEIAGKLGNYGKFRESAVTLDTELSRDDGYDRNLFIIGGVLTNTAAKKFNDCFPARFSGDEFPYREITADGSTFTEPNVGMVAKAENPEQEGSYVYIAAGVRNQGTEAAALAFHDLESIAETLNEKGYIIVEGLDSDGDGVVDGYQVVKP